MTLDVIKQAIAELPGAERASLVAWLYEQDAKAWDKQVAADFSGGGGRALLEAWDAEIKGGGVIPWEEFLARRKAARKRR